MRMRQWKKRGRKNNIPSPFTVLTWLTETKTDTETCPQNKQTSKKVT